MHDEGLREGQVEIRPFHTTSWPLMVGAMLVALVAGYMYYELYASLRPTPAAPPELSVPTPAASTSPAAVEPAAPSVEPIASLPTLDNSDALMRDKLARLMGRESFEQLVIPVALVRRIVATVDNLPRETAARRMIPIEPVPGAFAAGNFSRYAPYVRVFEAIDEKSLARDYAAAYPLFQRAYEELGYPGRQFHLRLLEAIDDLLAAPQLEGPVELIRPRIRYEFADPDLETRSAGQKVMMRMGADNAARVKTKLERIRRELLALGARR
ncbi:MAG TPA: DUF3014 domain-containing protein [Burkholderiales bacterium]|nr:DUF3014 domain-containing protein [Burkholderiales bacterium]